MADPFPAFNPTVQPQDPLNQFAKYAGVSNALANNKLIQQSTQNAQLEGAMKWNGMVMDQLAALAANDKTTPDDIAHRAQMLAVMPGAPAGFVDKVIASLPTDPAAVPGYLKQAVAQSQAAHDHLAGVLGYTPHTINTGGRIVTGTLGTVPGTPGYGFHPVPGGTYANEPSPEWMNNPQSIPATDASGQPTGATSVVPGSTLLKMNQGGSVPGLPASARPAAAPTAAPAAGAPPAPSAAPAATEPGTQPGAYGTTLPPGQAAPLEAAGNQLASARTGMGTFAARTKPLEYAISHLANADTGRGTEFVNDVKGYIQALKPGLAASLGIDPQKITDYDAAIKYMAQVAAAQPGAQASDMGRQMASIANASGHIDKAAAQQVLFNTLGMERMQHAMTLAYGNGNANAFPAHVADWNTKYDPRAFVYDQMDEKQKDAVLSSLKTKADKEKFTSGLKQAEGLLHIEMGLPK